MVIFKLDYILMYEYNEFMNINKIYSITISSYKNYTPMFSHSKIQQKYLFTIKIELVPFLTKLFL